MVLVSGNEIIGGYTNGVSIKQIYTNGELVWPTSSSSTVYYISWSPYLDYGSFKINYHTFYFEDYEDCYFTNSLYFSHGSITSSAFQNVSQITYLETNADYLDTKAFQSCWGLKSVSISNPYVYLGDSAFQDCGSLQTVNIPHLKVIDNYAFESCVHLTEISFPECVEIYGGAFSKCVNLNSIYLPQVSFIGAKAFYQCNLYSVELPLCENVGYYAFSGNVNLSYISLPECTIIGTSAFTYCRNLQSIYIPNCTSIESYAFSDCSLSLSYISLPKVEILRTRAFYNCFKLETISLPELRQIGSPDGYAGGTTAIFDHCSKLSKVVFSKISMINGYYDHGIFGDCPVLSNLYLLSDSVCILSGSYSGSYIFSGTPFDSGQGSIFVPSSLVNDYKTADNWSRFSSLIFAIPENI